MLAFAVCAFAFIAHWGLRQYGDMRTHPAGVVRTMLAAMAVTVGPIFGAAVLLATPLDRTVQRAVCILAAWTCAAALVMGVGEWRCGRDAGWEHDYASACHEAAGIAVLFMLFFVSVFQAVVVSAPAAAMLPCGLSAEGLGGAEDTIWDL
jgi:hypothetical protein